MNIVICRKGHEGSMLFIKVGGQTYKYTIKTILYQSWLKCLCLITNSSFSNTNQFKVILVHVHRLMVAVTKKAKYMCLEDISFKYNAVTG